MEEEELPTIGILTLLTHGISTPYPWNIDSPTHGILTPLPMEYQTLSYGIMNSSFGRNEVGGGSKYNDKKYHMTPVLDSIFLLPITVLVQFWGEIFR